MNHFLLNFFLPSSTHFFKELRRKIFIFFNEPNYHFNEFIKLIKANFTPIPKYPVIGKINSKVRFLFNFQLDVRISEMYRGIHQSRVLYILKKFLKQGDTFIDVGANIGFISAFGASLVGRRGEVHSFEPVSFYFKLLSKVANINRDYKICVNNCALGDFEGYTDIKVSKRPNIGWNTMVPGFMSFDTIQKIEKVHVIRLDNYIDKKNIDEISLIKIDVEGYEFPVLTGLTGFFEKQQKNLPNILVEIDPTACQKLGYTLKDLDDFMSKYDYKPYNITYNLNKSYIDIKKFANSHFMIELLFRQ